MRLWALSFSSWLKNNKMALLLKPIGAQHFELVRDRIGEVLALELVNQCDNLQPSISGLKPAVWLERTTTIDVSEMPALNVFIADANFSNKDARQVDGVYTFEVDLYTRSGTNAGLASGESQSRRKAQRLAGIVRTILESPAYKTLGFAPGFIGGSMVNSMVFPVSQQPLDAASVTQMRIGFSVRVAEDSQLGEGVPLALLSTTVKLYNTNKGYVWADEQTIKYLELNGGLILINDAPLQLND